MVEAIEKQAGFPNSRVITDRVEMETGVKFFIF